MSSKFPPRNTKTTAHTLKRSRPILLLSVLLLLAFSIGCGPSSPQGDAAQDQSSGSGDKPDIDDDTIRERIYDTRVRNIPEENGAGDPIVWNFFRDEPLEIRVVDKQINGGHATLVLDIKTGSGPKTRNPRQLAGQIRTDWELQTGWVLRRWEILDTENISMKYKNVSKLPQPDSPR